MLHFDGFSRSAYMSRLQKSDWLRAGLELLSQEGYGGIRIDRLSSQLEVTKGSFYHHFKGQPSYLAALLDHWLQLHAHRLQILATDPEPQQRPLLQQLAVLPRILPGQAEVAFRTWAFHEPEVRATVEKIDNARLRYLTRHFEGKGLAGAAARARARLTYATFVGVTHLFSDLPALDYDQLASEWDYLLDQAHAGQPPA